MSHTLSLTPQTSLHLPTSQIFLYLERSTLERFSISNVPLSQTSLYLERFSISNVFPSQTFLYHEHFYISKISISRTIYLSISLFRTSFHLFIWLFRTSLHPERFSISNISPSQTSLHLKRLSISKIFLSQTPLHLKNLNIKYCYQIQHNIQNTSKRTVEKNKPFFLPPHTTAPECDCYTHYYKKKRSKWYKKTKTV